MLFFSRLSLVQTKGIQFPVNGQPGKVPCVCISSFFVLVSPPIPYLYPF